MEAFPYAPKFGTICIDLTLAPKSGTNGCIMADVGIIAKMQRT
jgi:hypothetical protein